MDGDDCYCYQDNLREIAFVKEAWKRGREKMNKGNAILI
uniref:Uncharacterized protein n=1 Tax=Anguilla anguilla TaxID=7936 RepID=A0A0E9XB04_ANGAN